MFVARKSTPLIAIALTLAIGVPVQPSSAVPQSSSFASLDLPVEHAQRAVARVEAGTARSASTFDGTYVTGDASIALHSLGSKVIVVAYGQSAMDALLDAGGQAFLHRQHNRAAREILADLGEGGSAVLHEQLLTYRRERAMDDITSLFDLFEREYGPVVGFDIIGSQLARSGKQNTFARVSFERGREDIRFVWEGKGLRTVQRHPAPAVVLVAVPVGPDQLAVVDPDAESMRYITFARDGRGEFKSLKIIGGSEVYEARRAD